MGEKLLFKINLWRLCESVAKYNASVLAAKPLIIYIHKKLENRKFYLLKILQDDDFQWVLNPLVKNIKIQHHLIILQEQLIDNREDENLLSKF